MSRYNLDLKRREERRKETKKKERMETEAQQQIVSLRGLDGWYTQDYTGFVGRDDQVALAVWCGSGEEIFSEHVLRI